MVDKRQRPVKATSTTDGSVLIFPSCGDAAAFCRPDIKVTSAKTKIYSGLKDSGIKAVYGYTWTYVDGEDDGQVWKHVEMDDAQGWLVSEDGRLKSPVGRIQVGTVRADGYVNVQIGEKIYPQHAVVADAFVPAVGGSNAIMHVDGNKQNNHFTNLRRSTRSEAVHRAYKSHRRTVKVDQFTLDMAFVQTHNSLADANRSVNKDPKWTGIRIHLSGRTANSAGFIWKRHVATEDVDIDAP